MNLRMMLAVFCVLTLGSSVNAQDKDATGPIGVFQNRQEYNQFFGQLKSLRDPEVNAMLPMVHDLMIGKPIGSTPGGYGSGSPLMEVLADPKVREELEIIDDQYDDLKSRNSDMRERLAERFRELDLSDRGGLVDQIRKLRDESEDEVMAVLLPHQVTRLRQLSARSQLRRRSLVDLLTSDPLKSDLEISEEQADDLREAEEEIQQELEREIARLREEARRKLMSKLNRDQREQVEEIFGDPFDFSRGKRK